MKTVQSIFTFVVFTAGVAVLAIEILGHAPILRR